MTLVRISQKYPFLVKTRFCDWIRPYTECFTTCAIYCGVRRLQLRSVSSFLLHAWAKIRRMAAAPNFSRSANCLRVLIRRDESSGQPANQGHFTFPLLKGEPKPRWQRASNLAEHLAFGWSRNTQRISSFECANKRTYRFRNDLPDWMVSCGFIQLHVSMLTSASKSSHLESNLQCWNRQLNHSNISLFQL